MALRLARRPFTVHEFQRMYEAGILGEDDRLELVEGDILEMAPIGPRHASCVGRLTRLWTPLTVADRAILWVQNPLRLSERTEVYPDVALLRPREDHYAHSHPGPQDALLVVEVADATLDYDREVKVPLYARAGVPEVWVVDLGGEAVEVYRAPSGETYREVRRRGRGEVLAPEAFPDLTLRTDEVLGPPS